MIKCWLLIAVIYKWILKNDSLSEKCNSTAKINFEAMSLTDFCKKYVHIYKSVGAAAIHIFVLFSSTYTRVSQ